MKSVRPEIQRVGERNGENRGMEEKEQRKCSPLLQHIACIYGMPPQFINFSLFKPNSSSVFL